MRNILILFLALSFSLLTYGQERVFSGLDCGEAVPPRPWLKGEKYVNACDSLWVLTPARLHLYEEAVRLILSWDTTQLFSELSGLEKSLQQIAEGRIQMQEDYDALEDSYRRTLDNQEAQIQSLRQALQEVRDGMDAERRRAAAIAAELRQVQRQQNRKTVYWAGGGFVAGVLTTFILLQ
jgi:hypothetical protein